jgi:uncharacterized DUF497 family protein
MQFRWVRWNRDHVAEHGVDPEEAEMVLRRAEPPYPRKIQEDKWLVVGRGHGGRFLQVIYVVDADKTVFVIHVRPISERERRRLRREGKS